MDRIKRYQILCKLRNSHHIHPISGLVYNSAFELLIAVLLSIQARDVQVNKVTEVLFKVANTPKGMLLLGVNGIKGYIKSIGLFNTKSENIIKICDILVKYYNSELPNNRAALESLPGIGRKTANIILNLIFGWSTIAVDTHVFRLCNRSNFAVGANVILVEKKLLSVVPKEFQKKCHEWMVVHGRNICKARRPSCHICVINDLCEFNDKSTILI